MFEEKKSKPSASMASAPLPQQRDLSPVIPSRIQRQAIAGQQLTAHTLRPVALQRQQVRPIFQALDLQREVDQGFAVQRNALQAGGRPSRVSGGVIEGNLHHQAARHAPVAPLTQAPASPSDWVQAAKLEIQRVQDPAAPDQTRWLGAADRERHIRTLRSIGFGLAQGFKTDRGSAVQRYAEYGDGLATLQRQALTAGIPRMVLAQTSPAERPMLQRAVDEALQRQRDEEERGASALQVHSLQRQLADLDHQAEQPIMERLQARRGGGTPLPASVQRQLEAGLNHDLSGVRVHTDGEADLLSKKVNAVAFTTGQDIYFQSGKFDPNSQSGVELLAHEATHTVQQSKGQVGKGIDPDAGLEQEARRMGVQIGAAQPKIAPTRKLDITPRKGQLSTFPSIQRLEVPKPAADWRASGHLRGHPPVRDEKHVPNTNVVEDEQEFMVLRKGAESVLKSQQARVANFKKQGNGHVKDYRFWFANVYQYVTKNEIAFAENKVFDYPTYVMKCVLYFDKIYGDNLKAIGPKVEAHWAAAFGTAKNMQSLDKPLLEAAGSVWSLVASMLAHIRFDLPRAEAWVLQEYATKYKAVPSDFRDDFFRMSAVFDDASRSMMDDMQKLLGTTGSGFVGLMQHSRLTDDAMRSMLGASMSDERLLTWRRMEAMIKQGKTPPNPYVLKNGVLTGDITASNARQDTRTRAMETLNPPELRPVLKDIDNGIPSRLSEGMGGMADLALGNTPLTQITKWKQRLQNSASPVPLYDRSQMLLSLIRSPAMDSQVMVSPMGMALMVNSPTDKDEQLVLQILQVSQKAGDLELLVNIVDSYSLLSKLDNADNKAKISAVLARSYYPHLDAMNAASLAIKWKQANQSAENVQAFGVMLRFLRPEVRRAVEAQLHLGKGR